MFKYQNRTALTKGFRSKSIRTIVVATPIRWKLLVLMMTCALQGMNFVSAQSIFVSHSGDDRNDGSKFHPVSTLKRASELVLKYQSTPDRQVVVSIGEGTYLLSEPLVLSEKFSAIGKPVIFKGDPTSKPVISGGYRIKGFQKLSDTLWRTVVPEVQNGRTPFQQLYVNNRRALRARTPNKGFMHPAGVSETLLKEGTGGVAEEAIQSVKLSPSAFTLLKDMSAQERSNVILTFYHNWDNTIRPLVNLLDKDSTAIIRGRGMYSRNKIRRESLMVFENAKRFIDEPGEWFLEENGELYYYPRKGETLASVDCIAPTVETLLIIKGREQSKLRNITFENIKFENNSYELKNNTFEPVQAAASVGAAVEIDFADNIIFRNCDFSRLGSNAVWFRRACSNGLIAGSSFRDLGAGAIKIGEPIKKDLDSALVTHHIKIDNNIICEGGRILACAAAIIVFNSGDNIVSNNDVSDFYYTGISLGWTWGYGKSYAKRNQVIYNRIYKIGQGLLSDMGGVYTLGKSEGTVISNNVIHDVVGSEYGGWGLYCDEGSSNILMKNNLVYSCGNAGFHQHFGQQNIVTNNIFALNGAGELQISKIEPHTSLTFRNNIVFAKGGKIFTANWLKSEIDADNNCYWSETIGNTTAKDSSFIAWKASGHDQHSIFSNPFKNTATTHFSKIAPNVARQINFEQFDDRKAGVYGQQRQILILGRKKAK